MACQMQGFVFIRIIGLLENSYIICTAFVKICILIRIHRIHFKTYHLEIFPGNLAGFSDIFYIGFGFAFTGKDQDFLKAGFCNSCHFLLNLFLIQKIHGKAFRLFPCVQIKEPEFEGCRSG